MERSVIAKSNEIEYPAEATVGDQWQRGEIGNSLSLSQAGEAKPMAKKPNDIVSFPIRLSGEVERLFDEMIHRPWGFCRDIRGWNPSVDLYETPEAFILETDLPGVKAEDVHVKIDGNDLVLQGHRVIEHSRSEGRFHAMERCAGEFMRRMCLPESVNEEAIHVQFNDGVLRLVMPKVKERKEAEASQTAALATRR